MTQNKYDFLDLFTFEMANNHQGSVDHGIAIIDEIAALAKDEGLKAAVKLQFRQLDTFVHPDYKDRPDVPHIPRFMSTRLSEEQFKVLVDRIHEKGLISMATPFDEESVDMLGRLNVEILKVASCSATDWPLIESIASARKPVIASVAGASLGDIDRMVSYFEMKHVDFALQHCVGIYPTPPEKMQLNQISLLIRRYPHVPVGFSSHEPAGSLDMVKMAVAKGARLFERHVGKATETIKLNGYSMDIESTRRWVKAYKTAVEACGAEHRAPADISEWKALETLKRGVWAKRDLQAGETVRREDVFFAMPIQDGQLDSGLWREGLKADADYKALAPLAAKAAAFPASKTEVLDRVLLQVKGMLNEARIPLGKDFQIEISHHYGLERFREFGAVIIDCVNRQYCKKLILQLPRQKHPYHFHKRKEETFQMIWGDLEVEVNGKRHNLQAGDSLVIHPAQWHKFSTLNGAIFEEISTTHYNDDSFYEDKKIASMPRAERKTKVANWTKAPIAVGLTGEPEKESVAA